MKIITLTKYFNIDRDRFQYKKITPLILILLFITLLLSGCENENKGGFYENDDDFIGTWKTESGSFSMGD